MSTPDFAQKSWVLLSYPFMKERALNLPIFNAFDSQGLGYINRVNNEWGAAWHNSKWLIAEVLNRRVM